MSDNGGHIELHPMRPPRRTRSGGGLLEKAFPTMRGYSPVYSGRIHNGAVAEELDKRTVRKLDFILLPFLALLFLFNSLDKSNIGNAETADFTKDVGLEPQDLNTAVAVFYTFFVALQPVGAALGRKYGMAVWVPACMSIWGVCTALHCWVQSKWQLILLRMVIGTLEAGFYPTTVSYLSLFYTRFEFGRRLALFYGQSAVAGALGGALAYGVFSRFPKDSEDGTPSQGFKSWQILFLIEGATTIVLALIGFMWLPHNARTAWFLSDDEREWAEERIRRDRDGQSIIPTTPSKNDTSFLQVPDDEDDPSTSSAESHGLLSSSTTPNNKDRPVTDDRGLTRTDIISALLDWKLWYLLLCNILSSMPVTAFSVFMPMILSHLSDTPANANLLTIPPFLIGAIVLYTFTYWSDKSRTRLIPILWGLAVLLLGLTAVVVLPRSWVVVRYLALCVLMSGTFVASPLTVAWFSGNTPEVGKRSVILGVNGWGNLAGVFSSMLFQPKYGPTYGTPFFITLALVMLSFIGYAGFRFMLVRVNEERKRVVATWTAEEVEAERSAGDGPVPSQRKYGNVLLLCRTVGGLRVERRVAEWLLHGDEEEGPGRKGDERLTFQYGL